MLSAVLSRHLPRARDVCRPPFAERRCVPKLLLAGARICAARAPCRRPRCRRLCQWMRTARGVWLSAGRHRRSICVPPLRLSVRGRYQKAMLAHGARCGRLSGRRAVRQWRRGARRRLVASTRRGVDGGRMRRVATLCGRRRRARRPHAHRRSAPESCAPRAHRAARVGRRARAVCAPVVCIGRARCVGDWCRLT
jgi:hypothetical protein